MRRSIVIASAAVSLCALGWWSMADALQEPRRHQIGLPHWSEPVHGLRVRMVTDSPRYRTDDDIVVIIELQNVSDEPIVLPSLDVYDEVMPTGHEQEGQEERSHVVVWANLIGSEVHILRGLRESLRALRLPATIAPGDVYMIAMRCEPGGLRELSKREELPAMPQPLSIDARYWFADPGMYRLTAVVRCPAPKEGDRLDAVADAWRGELTPPPVTIRVTPANGPERQAPALRDE